MATPSEKLLASEVVEDSIFYNPLAHWDYFADAGKRCVTLEQILTSDSTANESNVMIAPPTSIAVPPAAQACTSEMAVHNNRDVRKRRLEGMVAPSELSFVVSLLSSRWTKSCLHTRVLSATSESQIFWEPTCDISPAPRVVPFANKWAIPQSLPNLCYKYSIFQP
jgi:hypothetical protein